MVVMTFEPSKDGFSGMYIQAPDQRMPGEAAMLLFDASLRARMTRLAADICAEGMDVLCVTPTGAAGTPSEERLVPLETMKKAAEWLRSSGYDSVWAAGFGFCGTMALLGAWLFRGLFDGVAACSPMPAVPEGVPDGSGRPVSAFTLDGKELPFVRLWNGKKTKIGPEQVLRALKGETDPAAWIRSEEIECPISLIYGDRDRFLPVQELIDGWSRRKTIEITDFELLGGDLAPGLSMRERFSAQAILHPFAYREDKRYVAEQIADFLLGYPYPDEEDGEDGPDGGYGD